MTLPDNPSTPPSASDMSLDGTLDVAYAWVCGQRQERSRNNSIVDARYNWITLKPQLQQQFRNGRYRLSPLQSHYINHEWISSWTAMDALVLKALSIALQPLFSREHYAHCTHLKGAGGIHAAIIGCIKKGFDFLGVHLSSKPEQAPIPTSPALRARCKYCLHWTLQSPVDIVVHRWSKVL